MITAQLEALNRKTRILQACQAGELDFVIAVRERVSREHVTRIRLDAGIQRRTPPPSFPTPSERERQKINAALDKWNADHGRAPKSEAA